MSGSILPGAPRRAPLPNRLFGFERRWAEALFEAVLGIETRVGAGRALPAFERIDRTVFWRALEEAPAPSFRFGLRGFVYALTLWPILDRRWRKPFFRLSHADRLAAIEAFDGSSRYLI